MPHQFIQSSRAIVAPEKAQNKDAGCLRRKMQDPGQNRLESLLDPGQQTPPFQVQVIEQEQGGGSIEKERYRLLEIPLNAVPGLQ